MNMRPKTIRPAKKQPVNLRIDSELVALAKATGMNLSQALEETLRVALKDQRDRQWREENARAIESFNRYLDKNGIFGAEFREW